MEEATWSELTGKRNTGHQYIRNYDFDYDLPPPLGRARGGADFTMTAVLGHLTSTVGDASFSTSPRLSYRLLPEAAFARSVRAGQGKECRPGRSDRSKLEAS